MHTKLASAQEVDEAIRRLAQSIINDYPTTPLFVCLLRGSAPFAFRLMQEITRLKPDYYPVLDYMTVSTYGESKTASEPQIVMDLAPSTDLSDRSIIVLDDVLDTGVTAAFVADTLQKRGARDVAVAVLVEKTIERTALPHADYHCFEAGTEWLVGMGMDDSATSPEAYRWHDEILNIS